MHSLLGAFKLMYCLNEMDDDIRSHQILAESPNLASPRLLKDKIILEPSTVNLSFEIVLEHDLSKLILNFFARLGRTPIVCMFKTQKTFV